MGISFGNPLLLYGLAAAALPLLVHLLMRPRPQRIRFPTVSFLQGVLATGARAQRLRDRGLLLIRSLMLACLAALLAAPRCDSSAAERAPGDPGALIVVLDDSLSTEYRDVDGNALRERMASVADNVLARFASQGELHETALVRTSGASLDAPLSTDAAAARAAVQSEPPANADTLGPALRRAVAELLKSRNSRRRIAIVTDGAAHAWRTVSRDILEAPETITLGVYPVRPRVRSNASVRSINAAQTTPAGAEGAVEAVLANDGTSLSGTARLLIGGIGFDRATSVQLTADGESPVRFATPPADVGVYPLRIELEPEDRLPFDQVRFGALAISRKPIVWLLAFAPADTETDLSTRLYRNLLAPESLPPAEHRVALHALVDEAEMLERAGDQRPDLVILPSGVSLTRAGREALRTAVEGGARLLLAPSSSLLNADWEGVRRWISSATPHVDELSPPFSFVASGPDPGGAGPLGPGEGLVERRLQLESFEPGTTVRAEFADGVAALVSRPFGRGEIWLLATSPDPAWSDLGIRAAGMITWLHALAQAAIEAQTPLSYTQGEVWTLGGARRTVAPWSLVEPPASVGPSSPSEPPPPGVYQVRTSTEAERTLVVNWPVEESDLTPATREDVALRLGRENFDWHEEGLPNDAQAASAWGRVARYISDPRRIVVAALLALLVAEWLMVTRVPSVAAAQVAAGQKA